MKSLQLVLCLLVVAGISSAQIVPMTNDDCATAIAVFDGINPSPPAGVSANVYTNLLSTVSVGSPAFCAAAGPDVWFSYVPLTSGGYVIKGCTPAGFAAGTNVDSVFQVLDGSTCPPTVVLGCDDDGCGPGAGVPSLINVCLTAGTTYYIRVCGWNGGIGTFYVVITPLPAPAVPNDDCAGAIPLVYGANGPFSNVGAVDGCVSASCGVGGSPGHKDVWYSITAGCGGPLDVSTVCTGPGSFDTILTAYPACGGPELACNDDNPSGCGLGSRIVFTVAAGSTYLIRAASWSATAVGTFTITVAVGTAMTLNITSPFGPGSLNVDISNGPLGGVYFLAVTFVPGTFPAGWFFGLDLSVAELASLINTGFPFIGPLDLTCGSFNLGPIGSLPSFTFYSVVLGVPAGGFTPTAVSAPVAYTVP